MAPVICDNLKSTFSSRMQSIVDGAAPWKR